MASFEDLKCWQRSDIESVFRSVSEKLGVKLRDFTKPFYIAMYGTPQGLPVFDGIAILGRDIVRQRIRKSLEIINLMKLKERNEN